MKRLLWLLGIFIVAAAIGISLHRHPGVIVIAFSPWRIDIPLWLGVIGFIMLYVCFHWAILVLEAIFRAAKSVAHLGRYYRKHRAKSLIRKGYLALMEGNYPLAEKSLEQGAEDSEMPWLTYISAAKAAQAQGEEARALRYLERAKANSGESMLAVSLIQAEYYLTKHRYHDAITVFRALIDKMPNQPVALRGLKEAYLQLHEWERLSNLLPKLKKNHILTPSDYQILEQMVWKNRLLEASTSSLTDCHTLWKAVPSALHTDAIIALSYAKNLIRHKQYGDAELVLRQAIKTKWNDELVLYYGEIPHLQASKTLSMAENWLNEHPQSDALLLTLGRLCVQQELWGKAQRYYEASLTLKPAPKTYAELATLFEKMKKPELSAALYKKGLLQIAPVMKPVTLYALDHEK